MVFARTAIAMVLASTALALGGCGKQAAVSRASAAKPSFDGTWERFPENWYGSDPDHPAPPGGPFKLRLPYAQQYETLQKKLHAADLAGTPIANASTRCLPEGMPTMMGAIYPIEIIQDAQRFIVLAEFLTQTRRVRIGEAMPSLEDTEPSYNGYSVARWDGDTLVVKTQGVRPDVTFFNVPHSAKMQLTERIRLTAPGKMEDQVLIEDPEVLLEPYRFTFQYRKTNYKIGEYVCENNQTKVNKDGEAYLELNDGK